MKLNIKSTELDEISSIDFFNLESAKRKQACRIKLNTSTWAAFDWSFETFVSNFGDMLVRPLMGLPRSGIFHKPQKEFEHEMSLAQFIHRITKNEENIGYLGYTRPDNFGDIRKDYNFFQITGHEDKTTDTRLWIGSSNTHSGLHSDLKDNIFVQIAGSKILYLAPFKDTHYLYPFKYNITNSQLDPENVCLKQYPKVKKAKLIKVVLRPGDMVFIPKGWWHCFISNEPSISINHWFGSPISSITYLKLIARQGPSYIISNLLDLMQYVFKKKKINQNFFFSPPSNAERFLLLLKYSDFSYENNPNN